MFRKNLIWAQFCNNCPSKVSGSNRKKNFRLIDRIKQQPLFKTNWGSSSVFLGPILLMCYCVNYKKIACKQYEFSVFHKSLCLIHCCCLISYLLEKMLLEDFFVFCFYYMIIKHTSKKLLYGEEFLSKIKEPIKIHMNLIFSMSSTLSLLQ